MVGQSESHGLRWPLIAHYRRFLSSDHQTALILEDDVDWDIALRLSQVPLTATGLRSLLSPENTTTTTHPFLFHRPSIPAAHYWSPPANWEILWLGHCGDKTTPRHIFSRPHVAYHDATVLPHSDLDPATSALLDALSVPEEARLVHRSYWPLCTFAYAVTRASAQRILAAYSTEGEGGCQAFDVRMLEACRDHDWLCYTVTPELFHHIAAPSEISHVDKGGGGGADGAVSKPEDRPKKATTNIGCGARQPGFWVDNEDEKLRAWLMGKVLKGECLVDPWME